MKNAVNIFLFFYFSLVSLACLANNNSLQEVNTYRYIDENNEMTEEYQNLINQTSNFHLKELLHSAFDFVVSNYKYKLGGKIVVAPDSAKQGFLDCTNLIHQLFVNSHIPAEYASTYSMVQKNKSIKNNFLYIPPMKGTINAFKPIMDPISVVHLG